MTIEKILEQIEANLPIYFEDYEKFRKYLEKEDPSYQEWEELHYFIARKKDLLKSKVYSLIKSKEAKFTFRSKKGEEEVVVIGLQLTKDQKQKLSQLVKKQLITVKEGACLN